MSFFKKKSSADVPSPKVGDAEKLYQKLMPELGMEAKSPTQRKKYHNALLTRFMLPKAERVYLICVAVFLVLLILALPAKVKDISIDFSAGNCADVSFHVAPFPFLDSIHAYIGNQPIPVSKENGFFRVRMDKNGQLLLAVRTIMGRVTVHEIAIDSIDDQPPQIAEHYNLDGTIYIFLTDAGSGVDWENITASDAETGASVPLLDCNETEGYICLPYPGKSVTILAPDRSGNTLTAMLELVQE